MYEAKNGAKDVHITPVFGCHYHTKNGDDGGDTEWLCVGHDRHSGESIMRTYQDGTTTIEVCRDLTLDIATMCVDWEILRRVSVEDSYE